MRNGNVVTFLFRHLFGYINVVAFLVGNLFGNINVFARFMGDFRTFLLVIVAGFAFFGVGGVTFLFLFVGGFVNSFTVLLLLVVAVLLVMGDALGDFDIFADLFVFSFVNDCVRLDLMLAFP